MRLTREVFASAESSLAAKNSEGEWTREQRGESLDPGEEVPGAALGGPQRGGIDLSFQKHEVVESTSAVDSDKPPFKSQLHQAPH